MWEQRKLLHPRELPRAQVHGAAAALTRGTLDKHLKDQCGFRPVCCKYAVLGCKWGGIASGRAAHEDSCKRADMPGWKLLEKVQAKQDAEKAEHLAALAEAQKGQKVPRDIGRYIGRYREM